ncbi:MAG TPA: LamG-like jellyroll fold domain-containing protein [Pirellulales bacterium]|nr:LamG-like jellyroll fold domain-containing protein [Pirellulales bacterium]
MSLLTRPIRSRIKPAATRLRYDPTWFARKCGGQPSLFLPLFGPGRAGHANDYSSSANDAAPNAITYSGTPYGMATNFNGTSGNLALRSAITLPGDFTVTVFCRDDTVNAGRVLIGGNANSDFSWVWGGGFVYCKIAGTFINGASGAPSTGVWRELTTIRSAGKITWYVNGAKLAGPGALSGTHTIDHIGSYGNNTAFFQGAMGRVLVFPFALSATQLAALYNEPWGMFRRTLHAFARSASTLRGGFILDNAGALIGS